MYDRERVEKYIRQKNIKKLQDYVDGMYEQVKERESPYHLRFDYYSGAMKEIFEKCLQSDNEQPSEEMKEWVGQALTLFMKDYDDRDFAAYFMTKGLSSEEKIKRFKAYMTQQMSPLVRFADCSLIYDSHTAVDKGIVIPTHDTFPVLQTLGTAATELHQTQFGKFNNFALATLRVLVRDKDNASYDYYRIIDIPIKDATHALANLSDYAGNRDISSVSGRLRSSQLAKDIEARYQAGVVLAGEKDHKFNEYKPTGQILLDVVQNADYEHEYHHSELALFQYLESDACILMLIQYLRENNLKQNDKVYAAVLDIYSTQQYCQNCGISSLGLQAKNKERFFAKFEKALLDNGLRVPSKTRTKYGVEARGDYSFMQEKDPGIKTAVRCIANDEYFDKRGKKRPHADVSALISNEKEFAEPMQKNIKTETPISVIKIQKPLSVDHDKPASYSDVDKFTLFSSSKIPNEQVAQFQDHLKGKLAGWG